MPIGQLHCHRQAECRFSRQCSPPSPVGAADTDGLLMLAAHAELSRGKQTVNDVIILPHPIIDELAVAFGTYHEQWRRFSLRVSDGYLDVDFGAVIESLDRPPGRGLSPSIA
jgi:hypothetical protein